MPPQATKPSKPPWRTLTRLLLASTGTAALAVAVGLLYHFPPETTAFYPKCLFHSATGIHCPGCGSSRCLHSLFHGDFRQAAAYNLLVLTTLPFLVYSGLRFAHAKLRGRSPPKSRLPGWSIRLLFAVIVAFWLLRNVDVEPFQSLAPHRL